MPSQPSKRPVLSERDLNHLVLLLVGGQENPEFLDQETQNLKLGENLSYALTSWSTLPESQRLSLLEKELENVPNLPPLRQMSWSAAETLSREQIDLLGLALLNALKRQRPDPNRE